MHFVNECGDCNPDEDKDGLMCYPKCRDHFEAEGCCICKRTSCDTGDIEVNGECVPALHEPHCTNDDECDGWGPCINGKCIVL